MLDVLDVDLAHPDIPHAHQQLPCAQGIDEGGNAFVIRVSPPAAPRLGVPPVDLEHLLAYQCPTIKHVPLALQQGVKCMHSHIL